MRKQTFALQRNLATKLLLMPQIGPNQEIQVWNISVQKCLGVILWWYFISQSCFMPRNVCCSFQVDSEVGQGGLGSCTAWFKPFLASGDTDRDITLFLLLDSFLLAQAQSFLFFISPSFFPGFQQRFFRCFGDFFFPLELFQLGFCFFFPLCSQEPVGAAQGVNELEKERTPQPNSFTCWEEERNARKVHI